LLDDAGTSKVIGYFVNTLPLRNVVQPEGTFSALVAAEQQTLRAAMAAGDVPFQVGG
jgi:non-ribosomal peptide synthetase component F